MMGGGAGGYMQAAGLVGELGTDIWGMIEGDDLYGRKPDVAPWKKLKLDEEQKKSILGNIENFDDIAKLGELYTQYITQQKEELLPGYTDTLAQGQKGTLDLLKLGDSFLSGELPQDVRDQVQRSSAYTALMGGYGGSGMAHALTARDLGLTSLDLMRQGADMIGRGGNSAQLWSSMAKGDMLNPASMMVTPMQTADFDMQNAILRQNYLQNKYNVAAAPDPQVVGMYGTFSDRFGQLAGMGSSVSASQSSGGGGFSLGNLFGGGFGGSANGPYSNIGANGWDYGAM